MLYAKIEDNEVIKVFSGDVSAYDGVWLPVETDTSLPEDLPEWFYKPVSGNRFTILEDKVIEKPPLSLVDLEELKKVVYQQQKTQRQQKQLGSFVFGDTSVSLKDREDSLIISSLPEVETRFKVGDAEWITLTPEQVSQLKQAHNHHVQSAYDWEMEQNILVKNATTHEELKAVVGNQ